MCLQIALQSIVGRKDDFFLSDESVDRNAESRDAVRRFHRMLRQFFNHFRDIGEDIVRMLKEDVRKVVLAAFINNFCE